MGTHLSVKKSHGKVVPCLQPEQSSSTCEHHLSNMMVHTISNLSCTSSRLYIVLANDPFPMICRSRKWRLVLGTRTPVEDSDKKFQNRCQHGDTLRTTSSLYKIKEVISNVKKIAAPKPQRVCVSSRSEETEARAKKRLPQRHARGYCLSGLQHDLNTKLLCDLVGAF